MLTIKNIKKRLLNKDIDILENGIWRITNVSETKSNYKIDIQKISNDNSNIISFFLNRQKQKNNYTLYIHKVGSTLQHIPITTQTLSNAKDFMFQLEFSIIGCLKPLNPTS